MICTGQAHRDRRIARATVARPSRLPSRSDQRTVSPPSWKATAFAQPNSPFSRARTGAEQLLGVLGDHVDLEVDPGAGLLDAERGLRERRRDERDGEVGLLAVGDGADGEADAVDRDRALLDDVAREVGRQRDAHQLPVLAGGALQDGAGAVDVALHDVSAEAAVGDHRALQVDPVAGAQVGEAGAGERLGHHVGGELAALQARRAGLVGDGQADAVDRDGRPVLGVRGDDGTAHRVTRGVGQGLDGDDLAEFLDDSGEHRSCSLIHTWSGAPRDRGRRKDGSARRRGAVVRTSGPLPRQLRRGTSDRARLRRRPACRLPSGLSAAARSIATAGRHPITVGPGVSPGPPSILSPGSAGSRTVTAGSEFHRPRGTLSSTPTVCHGIAFPCPAVHGVAPITSRPGTYSYV